MNAVTTINYYLHPIINQVLSILDYLEEISQKQLAKFTNLTTLKIRFDKQIIYYSKVLCKAKRQMAN